MRLLSTVTVLSGVVLYCSALMKRPCILPHGNHGYCLPLAVCEPLETLHNKTDISAQELLFLQQSACEHAKDYTHKICCPPISEWSKIEFHDQYTEDDEESFYIAAVPPRPSVVEEECEPSVVPADPGSQCCGVGEDIPTYTEDGVIYNSGFPWLARIEYQDVKRRCAGTLISASYVLTAAHCVLDVITQVHLGHVTRPDEQLVAVVVENTIPHPLYDAKKRIHDIGLIKLANHAPSRGSIAPICLPTHDIQIRGMKKHYNFAVSGWSTQDENRTCSTPVPYPSFKTCQKQYATRLIDEQLCAGGKKKEYCESASGGPLELFDQVNSAYMIVGVVSFGPRNSTRKDNPLVYTHVFKYLNWIHETIERNI